MGIRESDEEIPLSLPTLDFWTSTPSMVDAALPSSEVLCTLLEDEKTLLAGIWEEVGLHEWHSEGATL